MPDPNYLHLKIIDNAITIIQNIIFYSVAYDQQIIADRDTALSNPDQYQQHENLSTKKELFHESHKIEFRYGNGRKIIGFIS